jgi:membrane fusion protein (multidrug efflux system)
MAKMQKRLSRAAAGLMAACLMAASLTQPASAQEAPSPPPVPVGVIETAAKDLPILNELPGRIAPTRIAEVRARVSGIIVARVFEQGSMVKEGDVLFKIDPAQFKVQVASALATLQLAQATRLRAQQQADRQKELRNRNVSSEEQLEVAIAALAQADANVAVAQAGLDAAELDLQYTDVRAPISGRIGAALITEGALVSINSPVNLATIQQLDPVYADFTQSASALLRLRRELEIGSLTSPEPGEARVWLRLDDGTPYEHAGRLLFSEAAVDATTGQVTMRGDFPNPNGDLLPGMYVRVQIEQGIQKNVIAIPQQAVQRDASGQSQVYVVKDDNTVELRQVTAGRVTGDQWVIQSGLEPGEKIVVEGFQKLRPGAPVSPQPWTADGAAKETASGEAAKTN